MSAPGGGSGRAAFFEVDGVLLADDSRMDFLRFWLRETGDDGGRFRRAVRDLARTEHREVPADHAHRAYARHFAGARPAELDAAGRRWYAAYRGGRAPFVAAALEAVARHRADGDLIALVSAAPAACVRPLARDLGARLVLSAELATGRDRCLDGALCGPPLTGDHKAAAVVGALAVRGVDAARSFAYAWHSADLPLLTVVGNPRVVAGDPRLVARARAEGWPVLPATPCAARSRCA